jgi:hypothetical protein
VRERALETAPRFDRRADDDELGAALVRDARDFLPEEPRACADDLAPDADAVRRRDCCGRFEPTAQLAELVDEARVERQLPLDEERRDENDPRAAFGGEPAREVERVIRLFSFEQRHDDRPVADRPGATRKPARPAEMEVDVGESHRTSG